MTLTLTLGELGPHQTTSALRHSGTLSPGLAGQGPGQSTIRLEGLNLLRIGPGSGLVSQFQSVQPSQSVLTETYSRQGTLSPVILSQCTCSAVQRKWGLVRALCRLLACVLVCLFVLCFAYMVSMRSEFPGHPALSNPPNRPGKCQVISPS